MRFDHAIPYARLVWLADSLKPSLGHIVGDDLTFLTPYWKGEAMMGLHLASIRKHHPSARIFVSKRGGDPEEMEMWKGRYGIEYWLEDCDYDLAHLRLLKRVRTRFACYADHDVVLLSSLQPYLVSLNEGQYDLVGVEERIREAPQYPWQYARPEANGWLRFAPAQVASNFLLFDAASFKKKWGLRGVAGRKSADSLYFEFDYGIGQRLSRHKYLQPYHVGPYGMGNLLRDGERNIAWHQWFGSVESRYEKPKAEDSSRAVSETRRFVREGEAAFLRDFPNLDLSTCSPAWGTQTEVEEQLQFIASAPATRSAISALAVRIRRWKSYPVREVYRRVVARLERWILTRFF